jgi:transaldolase
VERLLTEGINVNITLLFSLEHYRQVAEAHLRALESRTRAGHPIDRLASVASFFVSRVDTEVDRRLDKIGTAEAAALRGKAAIANARLAYELYEERFATPRWEALRQAGARPQRPLWASTSTKDPAFPDTMYVEELVAPGTVNTMPEATLHAMADHGKVRGDTASSGYDQARQVFADLEALGIGYQDVVTVLEDEGVAKFAASWQEMLETISTALAAAGRA